MIHTGSRGGSDWYGIYSMKILIVGAGIAGLSLAAHLQKQNHDITIIEKDPNWDRRGYALILHYNGLRTLESLSILDTIVRKGSIFKEICLRDGNGKIIKQINYTTLFHSYGPSIAVLRHILHQELQAFNKYPIHMNTTVDTIQESEKGVTVRFSNNTQKIFDLVVGADGIHSQVRESMFTRRAKKYVNGEYWTAIIPSLTSHTIRFPELMMHNNKSFVIYPFDSSNRLCITFGCAIPKKLVGKSSSKEELQKLFSDFGAFVPAILQCLPAYETMYHGFVAEIRLKKWYSERIVLIGDAAHAINPVNGTGASMVLEDSYVLAEELGNSDNLSRVLENYFTRRKKRVCRVQKDARSLATLVKIGNPITNMPRKFYIKLLQEKQFVSKLEKSYK